MTRRYRSDPAIMWAAVRSVPRSIPDPKLLDWNNAPVVFRTGPDSPAGRGADTGSAPHGLDVPRIVSLPGTSVDRPVTGHLPHHDGLAAGHVTAPLSKRKPAIRNPHTVREPLDVHHSARTPHRTVRRRPRHRAAPRTHRTAWMTLAAVAVAFLAGTTMAALDSSTERTSPLEGSSAGGSTALLGPPRTGGSLERLHPSFTDNLPDAQPPVNLAGEVVDMNSETAPTVRPDTAQPGCTA
jgi:hypothetical protein